MSIALGRRRGAGFSGRTRIEVEDRELHPHRDKPWFRAALMRRLGATLSGEKEPKQQIIVASTEALDRQVMIAGSTGGGKSYGLLMLLLQLIASGCSLVLLDPKGETYERLLSLLVALHIDPCTVTLLDPRCPETAPGWNPLLSPVPLTQAVSDFVAVLERASSNWGPRLNDLLINALILVGSHGLSLYELARLLVREEYRDALLSLPIQDADPIAYREAVSFLQHEMGGWSRSEQVRASSPVLNKLREALRNSFLFSVLCARKNTLDLSQLWQRPGLVLVRLDQSTLGEDGTRLLSGLLVHQLFRTALRTTGPVKVVLAIDELPELERFVGGAVEQIAVMARSLGLRLVVCYQHPGQLSQSLKETLFANTGVQIFFRQAYEDARLVAASLSAGTPSRLSRVLVSVKRRDRQSGQPELGLWRHRIEDPAGRPLKVRDEVWERLRWDSMLSDRPLEVLQVIARQARVPRLYVRAPDTGSPVEIRRYVQGLAVSDFWIEGPRLQLVVSFPNPQVVRAERWMESDVARVWTRTLQELPVQHAALRLLGRPQGVVKTPTLKIPSVSPEQLKTFLQHSQAANGQSADEMTAMLRWREKGVEQLVRGTARGVASDRNGTRRSGRAIAEAIPDLSAEIGSANGSDFALEVDDGSLF